MLRGIPDIIGSDLLKALADTGHGDLIAIVDHFYPPVTKAPHAVSIQAKGCGAAFPVTWVSCSRMAVPCRCSVTPSALRTLSQNLNGLAVEAISVTVSSAVAAR